MKPTQSQHVVIHVVTFVIITILCVSNIYRAQTITELQAKVQRITITDHATINLSDKSLTSEELIQAISNRMMPIVWQAMDKKGNDIYKALQRNYDQDLNRPISPDQRAMLGQIVSTYNYAMQYGDNQSRNQRAFTDGLRDYIPRIKNNTLTKEDYLFIVGIYNSYRY